MATNSKLRTQIRSCFSQVYKLDSLKQSDGSPTKALGMPVARLKTLMSRFLPPNCRAKNQREFVEMIREVKLAMEWSEQAGGYVVYDPLIPLGSLFTYTAVCVSPESGEEIDVRAQTEPEALEMVAAQLEMFYTPGARIMKLVRRIPGTLFV